MTMEVKINRISQNIIKSIYAVYKENIEDTENLLDVYNDSKKKQLEVVLEGINQIAKLFPGEEGKSDEKVKTKAKRPLNPYVMFCNEKRSEVKEDNPDLAPKEITKVLGQMWQELDDEEKEKYRPVDSTPAKKKSSPGRGISGWILFCSENRASTQRDNSDLPPKEITKVLGQMWRDLSEEERHEFNDKAKTKVDEMKKKYEEEVDEKPKKEKKSKKSEKVSEDEEVEEKPKKEKKSKKSEKVSEDEEVEEEPKKKSKEKKIKKSSDDEDEVDRKVRSIFEDEDEVAAKTTKKSPSKVPKPKKH